MTATSKSSSSTNVKPAASQAQSAHLSPQPDTNFERVRVSQLEGHAIALHCPVAGDYSGVLTLKLAMDSVRTSAGSSLRYAVGVENPKVPEKRWLTEAGMLALEAKLAVAPLVIPSAHERRAVAKARRARHAQAAKA